MNGNPRKKMKTTNRINGVVGRKRNPNATTPHEIFDHDDMVCDILSRLPAQSVLQVKLVCKQWRSLIRKEYFIDLHFRRSESRQRLFFVNSLVIDDRHFGINYKGFGGGRPVCFLTSDLSFAGPDAGEARRRIRTRSNKNSAIYSMTDTTDSSSPPFSYNEILGALNGLVCFVDDLNRAACIYNISTREVTPWVGSVLLEEMQGWDHVNDRDTRFEFGFDPVTKDYKVICLSRFSRRAEDGSIQHQEVWEVLKLGDDAWRRIQDVPSSLLGEKNIVSIHVDGTIYWFPGAEMYQFGLYLLALDVGTEKFRTIQIPTSIAEQILNPHEVFSYWMHLLKVDGCVAVLRRMSDRIIKLFIFDDEFKKSSGSTGDAGKNLDTVGDGNWFDGGTIRLPMSCELGTDPIFDSVAGTDKIIVEIHTQDSEDWTSIRHYYCDWKKNKTFKEMGIRGFPSLIPHDPYGNCMGIPFTENLLPLCRGS